MIVRVRLLSAAAEVGHALGRSAAPRETGGIALGWYEKGCIVVAELLEVTDPNSTTNAFERDPVEASRLLSERTRVASNMGYVGEWHSHPKLVRPSSTDRQSIRQLGVSSAMPLALVVIALGEAGVFRAYSVAVSNSRSRSELRRLANSPP